ncbi:hypothetical protein CHS0354_009801 [Potamilus streckersoni]|uniref:Uncharacterized protein n=1 Tax=Potamilus streckersoni TaxID=2493646 RepID=A0AAE0SQP7_9BIVA|nr:hypothetical protein CHS0354_009801 [Potamilus streckersoni]
MAEYHLENGVKVSMSMLCYVSAYSSVQAVASIIHRLKISCTWNQHCDDSSKALEKAYSENKCDVHDLLKKEGVSLTMKNFSGIVKGVFVSLKSVKNAVQHLKDTDNWDSKCFAFEAFRKAYRKQKDDVCNLLVQEGNSLTMKDLSSLITESLVSLQSFKIIIHHLKDTGSWDPKCTDVSKALDKAYFEDRYDKKAFEQQKYKVCDLLIKEDVLLTMKNLLFKIQIFLSEDDVKTYVKLLQYIGSWDTKCNDAFEALGEAYSKHWYDVSDLLVHEGVSLAMKHLPCMILRSLDYVKNVLIHLKDTDIWDPNCDDACEALEKAYVEQKYSVCNLLVQEGVSLIMKNLHGVIMRRSVVLLESVKKVIHLKDTGCWCPKCDDGSSTLERVYWAQRYDVCDLLVQEGVSLTMKILLVS